MNQTATLNDEDAVTMKALATFSLKGQDVPVARVRVGYGYLIEKLAKKGFIALDGGFCTLTFSGRTELARLAAI